MQAEQGVDRLTRRTNLDPKVLGYDRIHIEQLETLPTANSASIYFLVFANLLDVGGVVLLLLWGDRLHPGSASHACQEVKIKTRQRADKR